MLGNAYPDQNCSIARSLEVVGERWTLLILRNAFYGVRHFNDFATQLGIPRATLTSRLNTLVQHGILERNREAGTGEEYTLTAKGVSIWPVLRELMEWGDAFYAPSGRPRLLHHTSDGGRIDAQGHCEQCQALVPPDETRIEPGPGLKPGPHRGDPVSAALNTPRQLLQPLAAPAASRPDQDRQ